MGFLLEESLGFLLSKTNMKLKNELFKRFREFDITPEQWSVLNCLWVQEGATPKELADLIFKDKPNTNHILEKLQDKKLIIRKPHMTDKRAYQIYLTERGRSLEDILVPIAEQLLGEATKGISEEQVSEMKRLLNAVFSNLG